MQELYKTFKSEFARLSDGEPDIAIAVSGGADSMALALLLGKWAKESNINLTAITVDHRLRAESENEASLVNKWLAGYGISHKTLQWDEHKNTSNIQAKARNARYRLMADYCTENNIKMLAVAHTLDDQAETVLMRLMRGSGVDGLSGIADSSNIFGIHVIRPLLKITGKELREYLSHTAQKWVEDPSNDNTKYTRVRLRKFIKSNEDPELLSSRLADTAIHMLRSRRYIEEQIWAHLVGVFTFHKEGFYTIDVAKFKLLHEEERLRSLAAALQHTSGNDYKPRFEKLAALENRITNDGIGHGCTLWGCEIAESQKYAEQGLLFIYRELDAVLEDIALNAKQSNPMLKSSGVINYSDSTPAPKYIPRMKIIWDGRYVCHIGDISLKNLEVGALGADGLKMLKQCGFTPDIGRKLAFAIPKKVFYALPALKASGEILAVPDIGYYADAELKGVFDSQVKAPTALFTNKSEKFISSVDEV